MITWGMLAFGLLIAAVLIGYYEGQEGEKRAKIESAKYKAELVRDFFEGGNRVAAP